MTQDSADSGLLDDIKARKKTAKICLVGDGATGKTTFIRYMESGQLALCATNIPRTPFIDIGTTRLGDCTVVMMDLAGQRNPDTHPLDHMPVTALRGADVLLFFFSIDNFGSFMSVEAWYNEVKRLFESWGQPIPPCILVGNKTDLDRAVESINGEEWVSSHDSFVAYYEISLVTGHNVVLLVDALRTLLSEGPEVFVSRS